MRVLAYIHAYVPDHNAGAETTMHDLLKGLVARGHECTVLLSRECDGATFTEPYTIDGISVVPYDGTNAQPFEYFDKADVIVTHLDATERVCATQHIHEKPVVQVIHNTMFQTTGYLAMGCQLAVYNTSWVKDHHLSELKHAVVPVVTVGAINWQHRRQDSWDSVVVHPPITAKDYICSGERNKVTLINLWPGGTYGPTHTGKGSDIFWPLARRMPDVEFLAVKGGYGTQEIYDLPNVEIMDNTPNPKDIYSRTKVLLMPSRYESFGRVAIEAAASGIPTVAAPTPGLQEALGSGGLFCERDDLDHWERTIRDLLTDKVFYHASSVYALKRSDYWDAARAPEIETFCDSIEGVAKRGF